MSRKVKGKGIAHSC